jgi:hypothetical protein
MKFFEISLQSEFLGYHKMKEQIKKFHLTNFLLAKTKL